MDTIQQWNLSIGREALQGRTFLLGNKRAFSLSLPATTGTSSSVLHPHKWFGAYLYGRKFLEGQVVRLAERGELLSHRQQIGFVMGLTTARREFVVDGRPCSETFFVPDGLQAFAATLEGDHAFAVEPELDIRLARAFNRVTEAYDVEYSDRGVVVSNLLPSGRFDDVTEAFLPVDGEGSVRLYAAIEVVAAEAAVGMLPEGRRVRRKVFRKDLQRRRLMIGSPDADHAPLWSESLSQVFAPVQFQFRGRGTIVYGFGASREEAVAQLETLRDNLLAYEAQKMEAAAEILERARFETGSPAVDTAYVHVQSRLMDALVARNAVAEDSALERPATMILAGNQYFHDSWKRDENIALGFLLSLGFYDLARDVIADTWQLQDEATGRLPQRIRAGEAPPYHSSDGTLWALWRLYQYRRFSGDDGLLYEKLPMVRQFFARSLERVIGGLLPSGRTSAPDYLWETWMDTPHTPRDGFPVEIQMLWIACLRVFRPLVHASDPDLESRMERAESDAWQALQRFNVRGMPADSLDLAGEVRDLLTPNPYFCFGIGLDLGQDMERRMRDIGRRQLAGRQGIVTLAPQDWARVFSPEFLEDRRNVRGRRMRSIGKFNYHRGVEWNWLAHFFVEAELKYGDPDAAFRTYVRKQVSAALNRGGIGGISELFDLSGIRGPDFQAWSMAGFLEALHAFAGVTPDVPARRIILEPQLPTAWPLLAVRKWYGKVPFDVRYEHREMERRLTIEFPWGNVPEADVEISLPLPAGRTVSSVDLSLDGTPVVPRMMVEPLPGSNRRRVRMAVTATGCLELTVNLRRTTGRLPKSA